MATEATKYVTLAEAVFLHIRLMRLLGERRYGVFDRALVESALARPQQAAAFENADLIRQAATLYFGLIKDHPGSVVTSAPLRLLRTSSCSETVTK